MFGDTETNKFKSNDRVLVLKPIDNKAPLNSIGLVDKRLFTGDNRLRAIKNEQTNLWSFKYDKGILPPALRNENFTSFYKLKSFAEIYFKTRNIQITEVID